MTDLIAAARFERDWRATRYPARIAAGESDAEAATVDYQCWCIIAEWIETDRFRTVDAGGATGTTRVDWATCEAAAKKALHKIERKLAGQGWFDGCPETETSRRRCALVHIHRKLQIRRESIEAINGEFRKRRQQEVTA